MTQEAATTGRRPFEDPATDVAAEPFWQATAKGRLLIKSCEACGQLHWYPRSLCPYCMGETDWKQATGKGRIYSVSVTRKAGPVAYAMAYVTLDEGVTLMTNIIDCNLDTLRIGDRVQVTYVTSPNGTQVPMFTPETP